MDALRQDLLHGLRMLRKSPWFTLAAVSTLALGIAANATMFGFMNALLLRPFALSGLDRLVEVRERHPIQDQSANLSSGEGEGNPLAPADLLDLQAEAPSLASVAGFRGHEFVVTEGEPERVFGFRVTPGFFETIGVTPALGRSFRLDEGAAGRDAVVLLSHGFWQRRFGGQPAVLGTTFRLDGQPFTVVGVLPPGLNFPPGQPDVFSPLALSEGEKTERRELSVSAVARLANDQGRGPSQAAVDAFAARLAGSYPDTNAGRELTLTPLAEIQTGVTAPFLGLFEGAAAFLLLIACANVAGLLMARGTGRDREMALRAALGAGRGRIVRQLLTEGLLLSLLGAGAALWLAQIGVGLIRRSAPADIVRWTAGWSEIRIDGRTLAFTLGLSVVATLAFGLLPAWRAARTDLAQVLKAGGPTAGARSHRLRDALLAAQVALALILLGGADLMTRGFLSLVGLYQGFDPDRVVTLSLRLPDWQYPEGRRAADFYDRVLRGLEATPGIESAGVVSQLPADLGPMARTSFAIEGRTLERPLEKPTADLQTISPGYLQVLEVKVGRGRGLDDGDGAEAPAVAVVSESLARRFWPDDDPLGRRIRIGDGAADAAAGWRTIVGVVGDVKQYWFDREARPTLYVPLGQAPRRGMFMVIRSAMPMAAVASVARARIHEVDREQPVDEIRTMATVVSESASFIRLAAALMATIGLVALVLAAVGLYGAMAEQVARRTREIGVRIALGASRAEMVRLVVGRAARLTGLGLVVGLAGAIALSRVMASLLFGLVRPDATSLATTTLVLAATALLAAWIPVRRAARVDPVIVLREE